MDVDLRISKTAKPDYEEAKTGSGKTFYYRFDGGNKGKGHQEYDKFGAESFIVSFKTGGNRRKYRMGAPLYIANDPHQQLSGFLNADNTYTVKDAGTAESIDMEYGIYVHPVGDPTEVFRCHPRISNRPA